MENYNVQIILEKLRPFYKDTRPLLDYQTPFQLLIAVILSARTTDAGVNKITPELFRRYPDALRLAKAKTGEVEKLVKPTGFFRQKAGNIIETAKILDQEYQGQVPEKMENLLKLPGVGRKTAHVIRGVIFKQPAIIVDTHFSRVVRRQGLTCQKDPFKIEQDMASLVPPALQTEFSMIINRHGRRLCRGGQAPLCGQCPLAGGSLCLFGQSV